LSDLDWHSDRPLGRVAVAKNEKDVSDEFVQFLGRTPEGYKLRYLGSEQEVIVRTPREHQLSRHMLKPEKKDFSKYLLCPMPGTLISCSVKEGQSVEAGQQLVVVEAMKMQNVLRAERGGVVKSVKKTVGQSLKVDEVIVEFA
jgi:propionyl-CoA carboxylase alpha chain